ncbi:hypothetical protein [Staphylococcus petrasii]|uniref:hypothetical protein n=1 Tax=Staphylococcus petrasii TaxID=1276936 RepID=UPI001F0BAF4B|nr:hypothetical protein [Staphylococcus petrasii]
MIEIIAGFCNVSNIPISPFPLDISLKEGTNPAENIATDSTQIIIFFQSRFKYCKKSMCQRANFSLISNAPPNYFYFHNGA